METLLTSRNRASPGRRLQKNSSTSRLKIPGGEVAAEKKGTCMPLLTRTVLKNGPRATFMSFEVKYGCSAFENFEGFYMIFMFRFCYR